MESKYFGIINNANFNDWDLTDQENYLVKNRLFEAVKSLSLDVKPDELVIGQIIAGGFMSNVKRECRPTEEVLNDFYRFLLDVYKGGLRGDYIIFCREFDKVTFGQSRKIKRDYALKYFVEIFDETSSESHWNLFRGYDNNGLIKHESRFKTLKYTQEMNVVNLKYERELIIQYLLGNRSFFNRNLFETNERISDIFRFENNLIILIELNKEFGFEKDEYFTPKSRIDVIYEEFQSKINFDVVRFIDICIANISKNVPSNIVSLFFSLKDLELKQFTADEFRDLVNKHYSLGIKSVKTSSPYNNKHIERVQKYKEEWDKFSKSSD